MKAPKTSKWWWKSQTHLQVLRFLDIIVVFLRPPTRWKRSKGKKKKKKEKGNRNKSYCPEDALPQARSGEFGHSVAVGLSLEALFICLLIHMVEPCWEGKRVKSFLRFFTFLIYSSEARLLRVIFPLAWVWWSLCIYKAVSSKQSGTHSFGFSHSRFLCIFTLF